MKTTLRLEPSRSFPEYAFLPGKHIHPNKPGGHSHQDELLILNPINPEKISENSDFRYGIDLLNHGYYWESHVLFEAFWNAHQRTGVIADFFKALIKIAAGAIKDELDQRAAASGHYKRALELISDIKRTEGDSFLGFSLSEFERHLNDAIHNGTNSLFPLEPHWGIVRT
jgi:hypothetical protein